MRFVDQTDSMPTALHSRDYAASLGELAAFRAAQAETRASQRCQFRLLRRFG